MSKKEVVNEIFWLRAIACLSVVIIHSITQSLSYGTSENLEYIRMISMFGTPAFIFISEFLIAKSYSDNVPNGFLKKRVKGLLLPFVTMGIIYAFFDSNLNIKNFIVGAFKNVLLFDYVAYFIIIIFQFYILHKILHKRLNNWNFKIVLGVSLVINILYLSFFNFVEPFNLPYSRYVWYRVSWYPFLGWIFYFTLGYYCGRYYSQFKIFLQKHKYWVFLYFIGSLSVFSFIWYSDTLSVVSSKRVDVVFFTISVIMLIFYLTQNIKKVPWPIMFISNYSFNIYLLHKLIMGLIPPFTSNVYLYTLMLFIISLISSIFVAFLINKTKFGVYIIGRTLAPPNKIKSNNKVA